MPKVGELDTHSEALKNRIKLQEDYGAFDLNAWVLKHLAVAPGMRCLDIGCGRGAQSIPLAARLGPAGHVTALDISADSLAALNRSAVHLKLSEKITTIRASLDDLAVATEGQMFDRVVGCYSLYYVDDAATLVRTIHGRLAPGGMLFICGPAYDNNLELRQLVAEVTGNGTVMAHSAPSIFMEETAHALVQDRFDTVSLSRFENLITYPDAEAVAMYWRSHNLFDPNFDAAFCAAIRARFAADGGFVNCKKGLGIKAIKTS